MMKKLVLAAVLIVAALVAYNYVTTGAIALIPGATMSEQEREIDNLVDRLRAATVQFAQAGRAAGMSGLDTTADAEGARQQIMAIERKAREMQAKLTDKSRVAFSRLQHELDKAKSDLGIR